MSSLMKLSQKSLLIMFIFDSENNSSHHYYGVFPLQLASSMDIISLEQLSYYGHSHGNSY